MLIALISLPYINYQSNTAGVWFASVKGRHMALIAAITALIMTPVGILMDEYIVDPGDWMQAVPTPISNGLVPFTLSLADAFVFYMVIKKNKATNNEAIQAVFILFLATFLIFMVINIWFRGQEWD